MIVCGSGDGVGVAEMAEHEVVETSEAAGAAASWGTCEELLLVSAVKRHGVNNWNLIASELKARAITLNVSPVYFSEAACKQKYDVLRGRFASCSSSTMSQDEEVGNDMHWFEELRKIRVAHLKRELEHYDGSIGSLQVKIKKLKAEKAGDISANKQLGKSIANAQSNDQTAEEKQIEKCTKQNDHLREDSTSEVPGQCSAIDAAFGKELSKGSSLRPCSQALNPENRLHDKDFLQDSVNFQQVNPECDQWHDAVEDLHDASSGPADITVDADVHRDNTTEFTDHIEHDEGTVCLVDTVPTEPQVLSEAAVDELQDVEAAGAAISSEGNENMKSEQADAKKSEHLFDKSAESLFRDHEAGVSVLGSGNEDKPKAGVDGLDAGIQELDLDESIIVRSDRKPGADGTSTATGDATSTLDICEDGGTVQPVESDLRDDAEVHSSVSPAASLVCPESSGSMHLGEAGYKQQPETSTISEEKAAPLDPQNDLQKEKSEDPVGIAASLQKETYSEAAQCTQSHALDTEDDESARDDVVLANGKMNDTDGSPYQIDEGLSDKLAQDAAKAADKLISPEPDSVETKIQESSNPDSQVSKEVSVSGNLESAETRRDSNTAAAESVGDDHMILSEKSHDSSEDESAKASSTELKSASPEGHIVIALDEPIDNVPSRGSSKISVSGPTSSAQEETVSEVDVYNIGPDSVSGAEAESMEPGKEQPVEPTSRQDIASAECGGNTASINAIMDTFLEGENGSASPPKGSEIVLPLVSAELVQKLPEPEETAAATSELPSGMEASNLTNNGPAISDQVEKQGMQMAEKVVDEPRTSESDAKTDLGQIAQGSEVVRGHNVEDVEHIDSHAVIAAAVLPSSPGSLLPVGHRVDIDPANSKLGRDLPEIQVASIGRERTLQGIILDVKLEISKEESLEQGQTSVSRQQVASEGSRGRSDVDISSVSSPDAAGGDQSDRGGRVMDSGNELKPLTISPAKVKQEIIEYVTRDRNLQEIMDSAPKSSIHLKLKAEPNSPVESLAGGLESLKVPSSHEGSDSVQELSKDGGEIKRRQRGVRDHCGESQIIDKSEVGSPADGNDGMSPSSRRMNRREPRVPGKLVPLLEVLRNICNHKSAYLFKGRPEDPRYHLLIRRHMDLANVRARLEEGAYSGSSEFFRDLLLIFNNAMVFYPAGSTEFTGAKALFAEATKELERISQTEALLKRDGPATRTRELKKPKTAAVAVSTPAAAVATAAPAAKVAVTMQASQAAMIGGTTASQAPAGKSAPPGSTPSVVTGLQQQQQQQPPLDNQVSARKRPSTRSGALETSTNSGAVVDSEAGSGAVRSASVNITVAGPSTSRAEETTTTTRDSSRDGDQEVNGTLKQLGGRKKLHVGGGTSSRASTRQAEELLQQEGIPSAKSKGASGRASKLIKDVKDAAETTAVVAAKRGTPAVSAKAAAGKLKAERENEKKRERERESKEKEKRKASERDDVDDDDFLLRKGKSLAKLKDQEIIVIQADPVKPAAASSKAAKAASTAAAVAAKATNSQLVGRPVRGAARKAAAASSAKETAAARVPEQQPKKRVRK